MASPVGWGPTPMVRILPPLRAVLALMNDPSLAPTSTTSPPPGYDRTIASPTIPCRSPKPGMDFAMWSSKLPWRLSYSARNSSWSAVLSTGLYVTLDLSRLPRVTSAKKPAKLRPSP